MKNGIKLLLISAFFGFIIWYCACSHTALLRNHKYTIATIFDVYKGGSKNSPGDYWYTYEYFVNGKRYTDGNGGDFCCDGMSINKVRQLLLGKAFPIAYNTEHPSWNKLITTKIVAWEFKDYTFPDSLLVYDSLLTCKKNIFY